MHGNINSPVMTDDIIKATIDCAARLNDSKYDFTEKHDIGSNIVELFGGEPMLFPEKVKIATEYAKTKSIRVQLDTNGFWGDDDRLLDFVYDLNIEWIALSIDDFHKIEKRPLERILKKFEDHPITKVTITSIEDHFAEYHYWKRKYGINVLYNPLHEVGNSSDHSTKYDRDYCRFEGFMVFPDGHVRGACELCEQACDFGNVKDFEVEKVYPSMVCILPVFGYDGTYLFKHCKNCDGTQNILLNYKTTPNVQLFTVTLEELNELAKKCTNRASA